MDDAERSSVLSALIEGAHLAVPDDIPAMLVRYGGRIGADDVGIYLVDLEQQTLRPVPNPAGLPREPMGIEATLAGRCFRHVEIQWSDASEDGAVRAWVPIVDGTERLGVLEITFSRAASRPAQNELDAFAGLVAELIVTKTIYGDLFVKVRRTRPLSQAAELLWQLLPPLTLASRDVVITAILAPPYDVGGDAFDYAVGSTTAHVAIFDAVGHGLRSGLLAPLALAAFRNSRRGDAGLEEIATSIDAAIAGQYDDSSFVTGVLTSLDRASGVLRYCVAGHPRPLLLRNGRIVKELNGVAAGPPFGLGGGPWQISEEHLEPRDRVIFFTDGVIEARNAQGEFFGEERLVDSIVRASGTNLPPPETIRRLLHGIIDHQDGQLQDDATVVMLEWHGPGPDQMTVS